MLESLGLAILITTCFILLLLSLSALFCPLIACSVVLNEFILSNLSSAMVVVKSLPHLLAYSTNFEEVDHEEVAFSGQVATSGGGGALGMGSLESSSSSNLEIFQAPPTIYR